MTNRLPCGCIPGTFMCREARKLWETAKSLYCGKTARGWQRYQRALGAYHQHVGMLEERKEEERLL